MKRGWSLVVGVSVVVAAGLSSVGLGSARRAVAAEPPPPACGTFFLAHQDNPPAGPWSTSGLFGGGGWGVAAGDPVHVAVDDPATPVAPDWTTTTTAAPEGSAPTFQLNPLGHPVKPGDLITVSTASCTQTMAVGSIAVTSIDPVTDTVNGTAPRGTSVRVVLLTGSPFGQERTVVAGPGSHTTWSADFSAPGPGGPFQIVMGTGGFAMQTDANGNGTWVNWMARGGGVSASPTRNLHDGDAISVTGRFYIPGTTISFGACVGSPSPTTCGSIGGPSSSLANSDGTFTATVYARHAVTTASSAPGTVDCLFSSCVLFVGANISFLSGFNTLPISYSKDACMQGGWQQLTDADGRPFKNQGDCISHVVG